VRAGWLLLTVAGCYSPTPPQGAPCTTTNECPAEQECRAGVCSTGPLPADAPVDGAPTDGDLVDGAGPDGATDAAFPDAPMATDPWGAIPGLVARYPMDDTPALTGTVSSSDPESTGSCEGAACPTSIAGIHEGGYAFSGAQRAVIARTSLVSSAPFTVSLWLWVDPLAPPYCQILSKPVSSVTNQNVLGFGKNAGALTWESSDGSYVNLPAPAAHDPTDGWHHYALQWNGSRKRLYIDGEPTTSQATAMTDSNLPLSLGSDVDFGVPNPNTFFQGRVDELRIYNRALDPTEIAGLATSSGL
jgi:hypothetical protein